MSLAGRRNWPAIPHARTRHAAVLVRLPGSKLIYVRLEANDSVRLEMPHLSPRCSRLALSLGVAEWIFALPDGLIGYCSADYDAIARLRW